MLGPTGRLGQDVVARDELREGSKEGQMTRRSFASASVGERLLLLRLRALTSGSSLAAF
jgi:hypothetical protein